MDPKITLSWLLGALSAPSIFLSLLVPIHNTFSLLPQLAVAAAMRPLEVRKWVWSLGSVGQALSLLIMGYVALSMEGASAGMAIVAALFIFSLSRGVCSVAQKDVLGKTVSKTRRGRVTGWTESIAGVFTVCLALWLISNGQRTTEVVALMLFFAAALWLVGAAIFAQMNEPAVAQDREANAAHSMLSQLQLLRSHGEFRRFILVRSCMLGSALSAPYMVALTQQNSSGLATLGGLLLAGSLASFVSGPTWGGLADRSSARCLQLAGVLAAAAGVTAVLLVVGQVANSYWLGGCLFTLYLAHAGVRVGRRTHLVDMADADNRSAMVAVSNTLIGIVLLLCAGAGVLVDSVFSYGGLLFFSSLAGTGALLAGSLKEVQLPEAEQ